MKARTRLLARGSLVLLWLFTGLVSLWELHGQSLALLRAAHTPAVFELPLVVAGALLDILLGLALLCWHRRSVYLACGLAMLLMTLVATFMLPGLWLHPLGPLSKNVVVAALLLLLFDDASQTFPPPATAS
ncbi:DoxX-like family protein [Roseateles sp. BYS180W]|uniref:DoxX-like family protein n=1 Tax=Roseateles rivi TaxID=3299028 RepID=A0ABW7FUG6_9BURK